MSYSLNNEMAIQTLLHGIVDYDYLSKINVSSLTKLHPVYFYITRLARLYPYTNILIQYIENWPIKIQERYQDPVLFKIAQQTRQDEDGHDELILKDLRALHVPVEEILEKTKCPVINIWIEAFLASVEKDPIHFLSWLYFGEKLAVHNDDLFIKEIKWMLPSRVRAFRFYKIHSRSKLELEHVAKREEWIQKIERKQQLKIINELYGNILQLVPSGQFEVDEDSIIRFLDSIPFVRELQKEARFREQNFTNPYASPLNVAAFW